nr:helix-turn-helix transcriptional regulator [uncultured Stomatobaculum sp.]
MPNVKDCPGFETFGADVQQAREAVKMSRREPAEKVGIDPRPRYLANIELCGTIPSVPVVMQLIRICKLPAERCFNPESRISAGISSTPSAWCGIPSPGRIG